MAATASPSSSSTSSSWWPSWLSSNPPSEQTPLSTSTTSTGSPSNTGSGGCPVPHGPGATLPKDHPRLSSSTSPQACPVDHAKSGSLKTTDAPAVCPVPHDQKESINPLNMMPNMSQEMSPGQRMRLSTERTQSTIPKGKQEEEEGTWVYPSPQVRCFKVNVLD